MIVEPPLTPPAPFLERERGAFVFFSYAHRDKGFRDRLEQHLSNLKYRGLITIWHDREISAGEEWAQQIDTSLDKAHVILLLISASFMASEYCYSIEMRRALERHERHEADVIPILLRPVLYKDAPFAKLQMLPTNGKPIVLWRDRDSAFVDIAYAIERVAQKYLPSVETTPGLPEDHAALTVIKGQRAQPQKNSLVAAPAGQPATRARGRRRSLLFPGVVGLIACVLLFFIILFFLAHNSTTAPALIPTPTTGIAPTATATPIPTTGIAPTATAAPIPTPTEGVAPTATPAPIPTPTPATPIIIPGLLLLVAVIGALIAIGAIRARIGQRRAQVALEEARKRGYYEEAIEAYRHALTRNPLDADALRGMGNALCALGDYDQALDAFKRAIDCDSTAASYAGLGDVFAKLKRYSEAVEAYEKAIELDPTVTLNYGDYVQALRALGRKDEAERVQVRTRQLGYEDQE